MDPTGPNAMALEMARWLIGWGRSYPGEWDGMYDILQCLWTLSRHQYVDNRTHGILPITMAALTLARDTADEDHPSTIRLNKHVCSFYSPPGTVPRPLTEILGSWTHDRLESWMTTASQSVPVARRLRRGAQLTNSWGIEFMFRVPGRRAPDRPSLVGPPKPAGRSHQHHHDGLSYASPR